MELSGYAEAREGAGSEGLDWGVSAFWSFGHLHHIVPLFLILSLLLLWPAGAVRQVRFTAGFVC